ncbi:hypothetical protein K474DRAFT_1706695 [Panus rudis PR-1116 ss-1]|nr:hypothetical protein K474DRAFT_1706695 [Panus rudis PR-1116 ss-1]
MTQNEAEIAVAVYCASSLGHRKAFQEAAKSVGYALAEAGRPLVYGGGNKGIMGVVSGAALEKGGRVIGVVPYAMVAAGGEAEQLKGTAETNSARIALQERGREKIQHVVVNSMHERKLEMAKRACGFVGLPGGFGTFEEVLEVTTWSQLGIHNKSVIVLNILGFWEPLRSLIVQGVQEGFIQPKNAELIIFVDGPADHSEHDTYDWGKATLDALNAWKPLARPQLYDWARRTDEQADSSVEAAT